MSIIEAPTDFASRWTAAGVMDDLDGRIELVLEAYDCGLSSPWFEQERAELVDLVTDAVVEHINDPETDLGYQLIRLSSGTDFGAPFALLGLALACIQRGEQGGGINPKIPNLLRSQLASLDTIPGMAEKEPVAAWRELAIRRVEILVRSDYARHIDAVKGQYSENLQLVPMIRDQDVAGPLLDYIRLVMRLFTEAHRELSGYVGLLQHEGEKQVLLDFLQMLEELVGRGNDVLNFARR